MKRTINGAVAATLLACALLPLAVAAQEFPDRPIRLIIGLVAGGAGDPVARAAADGMSKHLGQPVVVDNRPGAAGLIAASAVANAHPDGYTLLIMTGATPSAIAVRKNYPLRIDQFAPISVLAEIPFIIASTYPTLPALIDYGKANPDVLSVADNGMGSPGHLISEQFLMEAGLSVTRIHTKGSGETWTAILGGHVNAVFDTLTAGLANRQNQKIRIHAVTSAERSPMAPEIPTFVELGFRDTVATSWYGVAAPAGTPPAVLKRLETAIQAAGQDPEVRRRIAAIGATPVFSTQAATRAKVQADWKLWSEVATKLNIAVD